MTIKKSLIAVLLAGALLAAGGCAQAPDPSEGSNAPADGSSAVAETLPTIEITSPVEGATVPAGDVKVTVEVTDLEFSMPSNTNVPGQGHVHFTLDDEPFEMSTEPAYTFKDVAPGSHKLEAEVVQNNTDSFDPPIVQEITFTVE